MKILLRKHFPLDEAEQVVAARIVYRREIEFVEISPVKRVPGVIEVFSSEVGIQAVREWIVQCSNVTSRAPACFQHCNLVPAPNKLICAGETGDSSTDDDDAL